MRNPLTDPYLRKLLHQNIIFVIVIVIFIVLDIVVFPKQISRFRELNSELQSIKLQVAQRTAVNQKLDLVLSGYNPDKIMRVVDIYFPNTEDSYSIFTALENLSARTGLYIQNYSPIPFGKIDNDFVTVNVEAFGSKDELLLLLDDSFYKSGRLATIHDVSFIPEGNKISFTMNFYTRSTPGSHTVIVRDPAVLKKTLSTILKYTTSADDGVPAKERIEYEGKQNPFISL